MTCLNLQTMNEMVVCCLPAFGSKRQLVPARRPSTCEYKHAATSSSLEPRLSVPDFVSQLWRKISKQCETKSGTEKLGFEATPTAEDKLSKSVSTGDKWLMGFCR